MALTGIQIYKWLPKTNCGECGVPTCLAFAMSLAAGRAELSACPYISDEAKEKLDEASAPPIKVITIGSGENSVKLGGETVMFRHEKRFENKPGIALLISDDEAEAEISRKLNAFNSLRYTRVGQELRPEIIALKHASDKSSDYINLLNKIKEGTDAALILMCEDTKTLDEVLGICASDKPLIYAATKDTAQYFASIAVKHSCPLVAKASNLDELSKLTEVLGGTGVKDIILDTCPKNIKEAFEDSISIRRAALEKKFRPLGYPTIVFPYNFTNNPMKEALVASTFICKYGGLIVISDFKGEAVFPLLVERLNIFSDPQRPLTTTQGIYEMGKTLSDSPALLTCNFSLTYFIVSGEIENSKKPTYLLIKDTEGLSVLTAWAAGKFSADAIATFIKKSGIADKTTSRKLIIPGYLAIESGGLEEELPEWEILIGPREASHIPAYLKSIAY